MDAMEEVGSYEDGSGGLGNFILVNSISGLAGYVSSARSFPQVGWNLLAVAIVGGWVGSRWGSRHYSPLWIQRLLAVVLLIAGGKLIFIP